jgi:8-oxo-dGTP pyrophosphatase MutT (NUDIX family)
MVYPRYASTVVLLRPNEDGSFEILLTRRPPEMRFLGGFYVFPGGAIHKDDYSVKVLDRCRGLSENDAQKILGRRHDPELALGHWVAGIRELFEEVGVLLCETRSGEPIELRDETTKAKLETKRQAIVRGKLGFGEFLESEGLWCDLSRIYLLFPSRDPGILSHAIRYALLLGFVACPSNCAVAVRRGHAQRVDQARRSVVGGL